MAKIALAFWCVTLGVPTHSDAFDRPPPALPDQGRTLPKFSYDGHGRMIKVAHHRRVAENYPPIDDIDYDGVRRVQEVGPQLWGVYNKSGPDDPNGVVRNYVWGRATSTS